jgi:EAL domain-containing protein (putative c-di-GMP-specific phosphodiesterase class I)
LNAYLERILASVSPTETGAAQFDTLSLSSRYQPIFCSAEQKPFGYEGLLVSYTTDGKAVAPHRVFDRAESSGQGVYLDWLSRALHLRNWKQLGPARGKLFLNVSPTAAIEDAHFERVFPALLEAYDVNPRDVIVEILETTVEEEPQLVEAVKMYKTLGCKVALDDFGAGASEMKRFWRLRPDIVKIDRAVLRAAVQEDHALRVLKGVVRMMRDCAVRVVIEGAEDRNDASVALDTNADFLQGYYFARPGSSAVNETAARERFTGLIVPCDKLGAAGVAMGAENAIHAEAIEATAMALQTGASFPSAIELLLSVPKAVRGYLMSRSGRLLASSVHHLAYADGDLDLAGTSGSGLGWQIVRIARRAADEPGVILRSSPHSALGSGLRCTTFSYGFPYNGNVAVLCADVIACS